MAAMVMVDGRLERTRLALPALGEHDVLIKVSACGVCRTDLHILDGELAPRRAALVPGHEIVGRVVAHGTAARRFGAGARVGVPWLGGTCGVCRFCRAGRENLCERARFTGYDRDGGYAEFAAADERYCFALPDAYDDSHAAPLLCAGLIGYRAYAMTAPDGPLGLYGFGAAAHIIVQLACQQGRTVFAFTRPGDSRSQQFARTLGAAWAGAADQAPPQKLGAAIIFAADGALVPAALAASDQGASIICAGIHMSDIPAMPYRLLWGERRLQSVANLTRRDGEDFFRLAAQYHLRTVPQPYRLDAAATALDDVRHGRIDGAAVLLPGGDRA
ncbi:zinc-dependent alcohol dehydrogenase family protein [Massilia sp. DWR3-1-1]|uniref:zinc-dependent alcohol dehydrogenase family protein n=1 Tax=Massilia sp. DWR3-1-1 TaxID=2804559 RepID=UPI003CEC48CA